MENTTGPRFAALFFVGSAYQIWGAGEKSGTMPWIFNFISAKIWIICEFFECGQFFAECH